MIKIKEYLINPQYITSIECNYYKEFAWGEKEGPIKEACITIKQFNGIVNTFNYYNFDLIVLDGKGHPKAYKVMPNKEIAKIGREAFYDKYEKKFVDKIERIVKNINDNISETNNYINVEE